MTESYLSSSFNLVSLLLQLQLQISGNTMSVKIGPSHVFIFMGYLEHQVWQQYTSRVSKCTEDTQMTVSRLPLTKLEKFIDFFFNLHLNMKLTSHILTSYINCLDS